MTPNWLAATLHRFPLEDGGMMHEHFGGDDSAARFANILDITDEGVIAIDARQRVVLFNRGAERMFGQEAAAVLGQPFECLIPERFGVSHRKHVESFGQSEIQARLMGDRREVVGRRKDGSEFPAEVSICKFIDSNGLFFAAFVRDITERKRIEKDLLELNHKLEERVAQRTSELEASNLKLQNYLQELEARTQELRSTSQQLWQSAKLASVGELAASIAHELNNPLGTVSLRIESILGQTESTDPRRKALEVVEQEVDRMSHLVANLLQFSRDGRDQVSTVNIDDEIRMVIELTEHFLKRRGVEIQTIFDNQLPPIFADRQKLRQVFLNLFTNAGDAMPKGGSLTTRVRRTEGANGKAQMVIDVTDTGVGIPPEILPRVTDPFFTTKEEGKGTGLGLAICKRIVQEHRGMIHIESAVGKGTRIRITLPIVSEKNVKQLANS